MLRGDSLGFLDVDLAQLGPRRSPQLHGLSANKESLTQQFWEIP